MTTHIDGSLLCQNCGKPMADHDDMAHCWVRALPDQYDGYGIHRIGSTGGSEDPHIDETLRLNETGGSVEA